MLLYILYNFLMQVNMISPLAVSMMKRSEQCRLWIRREETLLDKNIDARWI